MRDWLEPQCVKHIQQFPGLSNYFWKFIQGYSKLATPLTNLTKKEVKWEWTSKYQDAFEHIKECLTTTPLLKMLDPTRLFEILADVLKTAVGGSAYAG